MDWITACGILDVPPDASEQRIKEQRNYWLNVLHPDKTIGLPPRIKIKADKDFLEKKAAWEYLLTPGNRPASRSSDRSQEPPRQRPASTAQKEPASSPKSKPKPVVTPSNIVFDNMEPGQLKKASFVIDNAGGPYSTLNISKPNSWLKVVKRRALTALKKLPLEIEIEAYGIEWGTISTGSIDIELDDVRTSVTVEVRTKPSPTPDPKPEPKPSSDSTDHVEPAKVPWWATAIAIIFVLGLLRLATNSINSGCLNALSSTSTTSPTAQEHVDNGNSYM
ncbi:MAG: hypothetical protein ABSA18_02840 [Dehalococcoidia bacterium]|jgi:hypothetical protein